MSFEPGVEERRSNGWWQRWWRKWWTDVCQIRWDLRVISLHDQQAGEVPWEINSRDRVMRDGKSGCWGRGRWAREGYDIWRTSATMGLKVEILYVREIIYGLCIYNRFSKGFLGDKQEAHSEMRQRTWTFYDYKIQNLLSNEAEVYNTFIMVKLDLQLNLKIIMIKVMLYQGLCGRIRAAAITKTKAYA